MTSTATKLLSVLALLFLSGRYNVNGQFFNENRQNSMRPPSMGSGMNGRNGPPRMGGNGFGGMGGNNGGIGGNNGGMGGNGGFGGMGGNNGGMGGNGGFGGMGGNNRGFGGMGGNNGGFGGMGGNNGGFGGMGGNNGGFGGMGGNNGGFGGSGNRGISEAQRESMDIMAGLNQLTGNTGQNSQNAGLNSIMAMMLPENLRETLASIGSTATRRGGMGNRGGFNPMGGQGGMGGRGEQIRNSHVRRYFGPNSMLTRAVRAIVHPNANPTDAMINVAVGHQGPPSNRAMMMEYMPHFVNLAFHMRVQPVGTIGRPSRQAMENFILKRGLDWMNGIGFGSQQPNNGGNNNVQNSGPSTSGNNQNSNSNNNQQAPRTSPTQTNSNNQNNSPTPAPKTTPSNTTSNSSSSGPSSSNTGKASANGTTTTRKPTSPPTSTTTRAPATAAPSANVNNAPNRGGPGNMGNGMNGQPRRMPPGPPQRNSPMNNGFGMPNGFSNQNNRPHGRFGPAPNVGFNNGPGGMGFGSRYTVDTSTVTPFTGTTSSILENLLMMQLLMPRGPNQEGLHLNLNAEGGLRLF